MINVGHMTTLLLNLLSVGDPPLLTGDGVAPQDGGWAGGTPNTGGFTSYTVLSFDGASPTHPEIQSADPEWATRWGLRHYGGSRAQADWVAHVARGRMITTLRQTFGDEDVFKVIGIQWTQLGGMSRNDQVDPPYWNTTDSLILTVSRVRISIP